MIIQTMKSKYAIKEQALLHDFFSVQKSCSFVLLLLATHMKKHLSF